MEAIFFDLKEDYDRYCAGISLPSAGTYGVYDRTADRSAFYNIAGSPEMAGINKTLEAIQTGIAALENELRGTEDQPPTTIHILTVNGQSLLLTRQELKSRVETARWELRKIRIRQADYIERINFTVIQHETAHQVLHNIGVLSSIMEKPRWLVEGLACLFETPFDLTSKDIVRVNHFRLKDLIASITGDNHSRKPTLADLQKAITDGRCVSLRRLINEPDLLLEDGPRLSSYYAVAWSLTYFLNRAYPVSFAAYLRDLAGRSKGSLFSVDQEIALLEKHFGPLNDAFVAEWSTFVLKLDSDTNVDQNDSMASAPGIDRPTTNPER